MAKSISRRRRKKAFQRHSAFAVSVCGIGDIDLTLFAGRRAVTRTLKAGEAQLLAYLLTQKQSQSDGLEGAHDWTPYTPSGAFRRRVVRCHQDNPMDLGSPSKLSAVTAAKHQAPLCKGSRVSCPRLSDSVAQSVCSGCGAVVAAPACEEMPPAVPATIAEAKRAVLLARAKLLQLEDGCLSSCAWRIEHPVLEHSLFTTNLDQAKAWVEQGVDVFPLHVASAQLANAVAPQVNAGIGEGADAQPSTALCSKRSNTLVRASAAAALRNERSNVLARVAAATNAQLEAIGRILDATDGMTADCWPAGMSIKREMRNLDPRVVELQFAANPSKGLAG